MKNFYDILGIGRNATKVEIKKAYISELRKYHPDVTKFDKLYAEERTKDIIEAFKILSDDKKRMVYNELLSNYEKLNNINFNSTQNKYDTYKQSHTKSRAKNFNTNSNNHTHANPNSSKTDIPNSSKDTTNFNKKIFTFLAIVLLIWGGCYLSKNETSNTKPNTIKNVNVTPPATKITEQDDYKMNYIVIKPTILRSMPTNNSKAIKHMYKEELIWASEEIDGNWRRCKVLTGFINFETGWILESDIMAESSYKMKKNHMQIPSTQTPNFKNKQEYQSPPSNSKSKQFIPIEPYNKSANNISIPEDFSIGPYKLGMSVKSPASFQNILGNIINVNQRNYSNYIARTVEYQYGSITINDSGKLSAMKINIANNSIATSRGIKIGSSSQDILNAYGKPGESSKDTLYSYPGGNGSELYFYLVAGKVVAMGFYYPSC